MFHLTLKGPRAVKMNFSVVLYFGLYFKFSDPGGGKVV